MKIEAQPALEGESTDNVHSGEIEILSFSHAVLRKLASAATAQTGSVHTPITVLKPLDKASPKLLEGASKGTQFKKVTLSLCQPSGTSKQSRDQWKKIVYYEVTLESVFISRMEFVADPSLLPLGRGGSSNLGMGPLEELDLDFQKIKWLYKGGTGKLNISGTWSIKVAK